MNASSGCRVSFPVPASILFLTCLIVSCEGEAQHLRLSSVCLSVGLKPGLPCSTGSCDSLHHYTLLHLTVHYFTTLSTVHSCTSLYTTGRFVLIITVNFVYSISLICRLWAKLPCLPIFICCRFWLLFHWGVPWPDTQGC